MATVAVHTSTPDIRNIKTRQQLVEAERSTRKLALQKRNERQDAFLSAQKQLLKTTEYIAQLDQLSHQLTEDIRETFNLLGNHPTDSTRHFLPDINLFDPKHDAHSSSNDTKSKTHSHLPSSNDYDISALIESFDAINSGNGTLNESYLMNHIDVPFLSLYQDLPLFRDKIQSSLYSSCIYTKSVHSNPLYAFNDDNDDDLKLDSMESMQSQSRPSSTRLTAAQYSSYLSAREVLIEKLLRFMLRYPSSSSSSPSTSMDAYYEEIVPFCLSALIVIEYQSAVYVDHYDSINQKDDVDARDLYRLFSEFVTKSRNDIKTQIVDSLQFVNDRPSLLISCLNQYIELLQSEAFPVKMEWTKLFRTFYDIENNKTKGSLEMTKFTDFLSDYLYHSVFMQCFESISKTVCDALSTDFDLLFSKLSTRSHPDDDCKNNEEERKGIEENDWKQTESADTAVPQKKASFNEIMASIQQNLSAILTFDHHRSLLHYKSLCRYLDRSVTPQIEQSTTTVIHRFISKLTAHLTDTDNAYKHSTSATFSLDEEYLEIGICCETLESFIRTVIDQYTTTTMTMTKKEDQKDSAMTKTPISRCLEEMISSISSLKMRALNYWSTAMSTKLFGDIGRHLERKVTFWRMYESYYTKTVWRSIVVTGDDDDDDDGDSGDIAELSINIPCQPSEYIHDLCFQFIQILLMIITQEHVPNSMVGVLENEFRASTSMELNRVFKTFLNEEDGDGISESLGLQFYFDVSFAAAILTTSKVQPLWDEVLTMISDRFIEMVTMEYGSKYLQTEIRKAVHGTLLMYGVHSSSYSRYSKLKPGDDGGGKSPKTPSNVKSGGGNIFARPPTKMPRIALLPVASYQISQSALEEKDHGLGRRSTNTSGLLSSALKQNESETSKAAITQSLSELKTGAMAHANTLLKGFGSMFQ